ncbi:hypothetical protein FACS189483_06970 [Spirochaetia bacterium]|nr:hypothetical protein FACS189483_06970 [Spirochaetia bacterium]
MDISINGKSADITLESEQTIGEVLSGIEQWLQSSELRLKGLDIDGESVDSDAVDAVFTRDLQGIDSLDIKVCSRQELTLDALGFARGYLEAFAGTEDREILASGWKESAAASYLAEEIPEIANAVTGTLSGSHTGALALVEERIRELADPQGELCRMEAAVTGIISRLEELPLDIQTGKDGRAAETISLFSAIAEKFFRLFLILKSGARNTALDDLTIDSVPVMEFLEEFGAALKEILAAYGIKDVVLVGDLAEYELAPRLRTFYSAIRTSAVLPI